MAAITAPTAEATVAQSRASRKRFRATQVAATDETLLPVKDPASIECATGMKYAKLQTRITAWVISARIR